jgi:hypothetical protein
MKWHSRAFGLTLVAASLCLVQAAPVQAACIGLSGTADGFDRETGISRAQLALADAVAQYKAAKKLRSITVTAMRAKPQPYWRDSVSDDQFCFGTHCGFYKPDIVTAHSYTICWHGVISPYVCTSGAKACW